MQLDLAMPVHARSSFFEVRKIRNLAESRYISGIVGATVFR